MDTFVKELDNLIATLKVSSFLLRQCGDVAIKYYFVIYIKKRRPYPVLTVNSLS